MFLDMPGKDYQIPGIAIEYTTEDAEINNYGRYMDTYAIWRSGQPAAVVISTKHLDIAKNQYLQANRFVDAALVIYYQYTLLN